MSATTVSSSASPGLSAGATEPSLIIGPTDAGFDAQPFQAAVTPSSCHSGEGLLVRDGLRNG